MGTDEDIGGGLTMGGALTDIASGMGWEGEEAAEAPAESAGDAEASADAGTAPAAPAAPAPDSPPATDPAADSEAPTAPAAPTESLPPAPRTWRPEAAAEWAQLSPTVRAEIVKREEDIFKGVEQYRTDATIGKDFKQAIEKYLPVFQQYNINPIQQVAGLFDAHFTLSTGTPEQKLALFQRLASDYNVNLTDAALAEPPFVDPQVANLQKELEAVKSTLIAEQTRQAARARSDFEAEVAKFQADPANVYFSDLSNDMAMLLEKGVAGNLREAYDKALRLNPVVFAKEQARQQAETAKKATEEAAKKAAEARKATSANVRSSAKAGSAAAALGSIDDTLNEVYTAIMSRQ